jgi:hypothetical protein
MKYFKFAQISADTGISWAIEQPISGPSWPEIPGLDLSKIIQLSTNPTYYVATVGNAANPNAENHIFQLTFDQYAKEIEQHVMHLINKEKDEIYQTEYVFRNSTFNRYHETASIAGIYKYEQAKALIADADADVPVIRIEAAARGVDAVVMANRIIENHESFRNKEAKISGIRGKILDRLNAYEFDLSDPEGSYEEFMSEEVIGTRPMFAYEQSIDGIPVEEIEVKVRKYQLAIEPRFNYE